MTDTVSPHDDTEVAERDQRVTSVTGVAGLVLGLAAVVAAVLIPWTVVPWLLGLGTVTLAIVGLARPTDRNALPLSALGVAVLAMLLALVLYLVELVFSEPLAFSFNAPPDAIVEASPALSAHPDTPDEADVPDETENSFDDVVTDDFVFDDDSLYDETYLWTDGIWIVGRDLDPGVYRLASELSFTTDYESCYWRTSDISSGEDLLIATELVEGGRPTVTLREGYWFGSSNCGEWVEVDPSALFAAPASARTQFPDGSWLVGEDIRPGTYWLVEPFEVVEQYDFCWWQVFDDATSDFSYGPMDIVEAGRSEVTLTTGQQFSSMGCGEWVLR